MYTGFDLIIFINHTIINMYCISFENVLEEKENKRNRVTIKFEELNMNNFNNQ